MSKCRPCEEVQSTPECTRLITGVDAAIFHMMIVPLTIGTTTLSSGGANLDAATAPVAAADVAAGVGCWPGAHILVAAAVVSAACVDAGVILSVSSGTPLSVSGTHLAQVARKVSGRRDGSRLDGRVEAGAVVRVVVAGGVVHGHLYLLWSCPRGRRSLQVITCAKSTLGQVTFSRKKSFSSSTGGGE